MGQMGVQLGQSSQPGSWKNQQSACKSGVQLEAVPQEERITDVPHFQWGKRIRSYQMRGGYRISRKKDKLQYRFAKIILYQTSIFFSGWRKLSGLLYQDFNKLFAIISGVSINESEEDNLYCKHFIKQENQRLSQEKRHPSVKNILLKFLLDPLL